MLPQPFPARDMGYVRAWVESEGNTSRLLDTKPVQKQGTRPCPFFQSFDNKTSLTLMSEVKISGKTVQIRKATYSFNGYL